MRSLLPSRHRIDDPRSERVVAALAAVGDGRSAVVLPEPADEFRAELRAQLVAVTPRLAADADVAPERAGRHAATPSRRERAEVKRSEAARRRSSRARPLAAVAAGVVVVVLGLGGATWLSRDALPGDALYGLKTTAEGIGVSLSGNDVDKGHALLVGAQTRVEEVAALIGRPQAMALAGGPGYLAAGALDADTSALVVTALKTADDDTHQGISTIGADALARGDTAGLELVVAWAPGQIQRIDDLLAALQPGNARDQAEVSAAEIRTGYARASVLLAELQAGTTCTRSTDAFGPLPCS